MTRRKRRQEEEEEEKEKDANQREAVEEKMRGRGRGEGGKGGERGEEEVCGEDSGTDDDEIEKENVHEIISEEVRSSETSAFQATSFSHTGTYNHRNTTNTISNPDASMYTHTHTHIYVSHTRTHTHATFATHTHTHTHIYTHICTHTQTHASITWNFPYEITIPDKPTSHWLRIPIR
jgi:hypothetical protein